MSLTTIYKHGEELVLGDVVFGLLSPNNSDFNNMGICVKIELCDERYFTIWFLIENQIQKKYILKSNVYQTI